MQQLIDFSKKQKIVIVGAGNIGSKLALKIENKQKENSFQLKYISKYSIQAQNQALTSD